LEKYSFSEVASSFSSLGNFFLSSCVSCFLSVIFAVFMAVNCLLRGLYKNGNSDAVVWFGLWFKFVVLVVVGCVGCKC